MPAVSIFEVFELPSHHGQSLPYCRPEDLYTKVSNTGTFVYGKSPNFYGKEVFTYHIYNKNLKNIRRSNSAKIVVLCGNEAVGDSSTVFLIPNAISPNGDGMNDEFRVLYRSLREYHIWVYNRWGKLVYESTDPAKGWDGNINGRPAAEGAYYYVIRAIGTDAAKNAGYHSRQAYEKGKLNADEAYTGVYQLSGDINLLRGKQK